jgi:hypothetical protein
MSRLAVFLDLDFLVAFPDYIFEEPYSSVLLFLRTRTITISTVNTIHTLSEQEIDLIALLNRFADRECADPHDCVFSLLSLCGLNQHTLLVKSLSIRLPPFICQPSSHLKIGRT